MPRSRTLLTEVSTASLLLVGLVLAGCTSSATAAKDVSISGCNVNGNGHPVASGTIDNHSSKASTYAVEVGFYDSAGNRVSEGGATVGKVEAGETAVFTADGVAKANGPVTCKVVSAARTVAP